MSVALNKSDVEFKEWQQLPEQTTLIDHAEGHPGHGWVQQDPSRGVAGPKSTCERPVALLGRHLDQRQRLNAKWRLHHRALWLQSGLGLVQRV